MVDRFIRAAETWGRHRYGLEARARACAMPTEHPDGTITADVDLQFGYEPSGAAKEVVLVQCLVTLEPDGSISCYKHDREHP